MTYQDPFADDDDLAGPEGSSFVADFFDDDDDGEPALPPGVPGLDAYIDATFGEGGYLAQRFPSYQPRPGQVALARSIDAAIRKEGHLLGEGPTGVGKSVGYGVPATYHAAIQGRGVVIVTANIALQEQLLMKDLPMLSEILPWKFSFASLKGRNNYLCNDRAWDVEIKNATRSWNRGDASDEEELAAVRAWAKETQTGDVSELDFVPAPQVWRQFSRSSDECKGRKCKSFDGCWAYRAKDIARESMVVVTNYHMFFAAMVVRANTGKNLILPGYDVAILDEAHKAADIAREFFGFKISHGSLKKLAGELEKIPDDRSRSLSDRLRSNASDFFDALDDYKRRSKYRTRLKEPLIATTFVDMKRVWPRLEQTLDLASQDFALHAQQASRDNAADLQKSARRAALMRSNLDSAMQLEDKDRFVYFIDEDSTGRSGERRMAVACKPIHVAEMLREHLFDGVPRGEEVPARRANSNFESEYEDDDPDADARREARLRDHRSVICVSATLSTGGNFQFVAGELGVPFGYGEIQSESPFNWKQQCLFIIPTGMPDPSKERDAFAAAVPGRVAEAIDLSDGRALALFTSYKVLNASYDLMRVGTPAKTRKGHRLMKQGDAPRTKLVETFREDISSVLMGTESLWAGVDVPGEALSLLVIDKIPFVTPEDPIVDAISAADDNWFFNYSIPRAIIQLKQGFGRGVRSESDCCVVVLLDPRIIEKSYGRKFLASLPPVSRSRDLANIAKFLPPLKREPAPQAELPEPAYADPFDPTLF